jgi:hypothetical protein
VAQTARHRREAPALPSTALTNCCKTIATQIAAKRLYVRIAGLTEISLMNCMCWTFYFGLLGGTSAAGLLEQGYRTVSAILEYQCDQTGGSHC